ncbi:hypothetical protein D3C72_1648260 [compost metagenome]
MITEDNHGGFVAALFLNYQSRKVTREHVDFASLNSIKEFYILMTFNMVVKIHVSLNKETDVEVIVTFFKVRFVLSLKWRGFGESLKRLKAAYFLKN